MILPADHVLDIRGALTEATAWDAAATASGRRVRVALSEDPKPRTPGYEELWRLMERTASLDWLLASSDPGALQVPQGWTWGSRWPENVWLGLRVSDQKEADARLTDFQKVPGAKLKFVWCDPLTGPLDLGGWIGDYDCHNCGWQFWGDELNELRGSQVMTIGFDGKDGEVEVCPRCDYRSDPGGDGTIGTRNESDAESDDYACRSIRWVVAGLADGADPQWMRSLVRQCRVGKVPIFVRGLGGRLDVTRERVRDWPRATLLERGRSPDFRTTAVLGSKVGANPGEWPEDLRVRQGPRLAS